MDEFSYASKLQRLHKRGALFIDGVSEIGLDFVLDNLSRSAELEPPSGDPRERVLDSATGMTCACSSSASAGTSRSRGRVPGEVASR